MGQSTRFFESFRRQRDAYERGELGSLELVDAHYIHRMDWFYDKSPWAATGTDWVFLGMSHPMDLVSWYLGPVVEVQAYAATSALGEQVRQPVTGHPRGEPTDRRRAHRPGDGPLRAPRAALGAQRHRADAVRIAGTSQAQYHDMRYRYTAPDGTEVTEDSLYAKRRYYFNDEVHGMHYGEFANYLDAFATALRTRAARVTELEEASRCYASWRAPDARQRTAAGPWTWRCCTPRPG